MPKYSSEDGEPDRYASGIALCVPCCASPARRPGFDTRRSKSPDRLPQDVHVKLRQHCKLQGEQGNARCCDGQERLRDPRSQICAVHVCILVDRLNRQQNAPPADSQQTHYLTHC